jgi:hypothetical protein
MKSPAWRTSTAFTLAIAITAPVLAPLQWAQATPQPDRIAQVFPPSWRQNLPSRTPDRYPDNYPNYPSNSYPNSNYPNPNPNSSYPYPNNGYPTNYPNNGYPDSYSWNYRSILPGGTAIPTSYNKEKIFVTPTETSEVTLKVADNVRSPAGNVIIPAGSQIKGKLRPVSEGTQFIAEQLILGNNQRYRIDASSGLITRRETISRQSDPKIFQGVAIGAVASAILGEIFGRVQLWQVLGGAGVGALGSLLIRDHKQVEVISIDPTTDLTLRLNSDFDLSRSLN